MDTLEGWCQDIDELAELADHTYVYCPERNVYWGCWGGHSAPEARLVCRGQGNFAEANCISQPHSQAGVLYGINGVCHQTANRILYPAGLIVSKAKCYWLSALLYGTYGVAGLSHIEWEIRLRRCSGAASFGLRAPDSGAQSEDEAERAYLDRVRALYRDSGTESFGLAEQPERLDILRREIGLMLEYRLGVARARDLAGGIQALSSELYGQRTDLEQAFHDGKLTSTQFAEEINAAFAATLHRLADVLEPEPYEQFLGVKPGQIPVILRPDIIRLAYGGETHGI